MSAVRYSRNLEGLPYDILTSLLNSFNSFSDFYNLLASSPVCLRLFNTYPNSVLASIAQNIVGRPAWNAVSTILTYQRNCSDHEKTFPNYSLVKKDLEHEFIMRKSDIRQFVSNHRFFTSCCEEFAIAVIRDHPQAPPEGSGMAHTPPTTPELDPSPAGNRYTSLSFTPGDTLQAKFFYEMWLLCFQFRYESIMTFSQHPRLSKTQLQDLNLLSRVMLDNINYQDAYFSPKYVCRFEGTEDLFQVWGGGDQWASYDTSKDPLLVLKITFHICEDHLASKGDWQVLGEKIKRFEEDYVNGGTLQLQEVVEKFGIDAAWG